MSDHRYVLPSSPTLLYKKHENEKFQLAISVWLRLLISCGPWRFPQIVMPLWEIFCFHLTDIFPSHPMRQLLAIILPTYLLRMRKNTHSCCHTECSSFFNGSCPTENRYSVATFGGQNNISVRNLAESRALRMERRKLKPCLVQTISYRMPLTEHAWPLQHWQLTPFIVHKMA